jgi:hypothetical protein
MESMSIEQSEERVVRVDLGFDVPTVGGATLLQDDVRGILLFEAWRDGEPVGTAEVSFGAYQTRFGYPNDEAVAGHPLYGKGLEWYGMFEVLGSTWGRTISEQNRVTFPDSDYAPNARHFIMTFKECTFEYLGGSFKAIVRTGEYAAVMRDAAERFFAGS